MTNGTKYHYWHIKGSNEKRSKKIRAYRCKASPDSCHSHPNILLRADKIEDIILHCLAVHIELLQKEKSVSDTILHQYDKKQRIWKSEKKKLQKEIAKTTENIHALQEFIPDAINGSFALSIEETASAIRRLEEKRVSLENHTHETGTQFTKMPKKEYCIPTWQEIFIKADKETQRVLVGKLVERIEVSKEHILIRFRIPEKYFTPNER